jgi:MFS family permease
MQRTAQDWLVLAHLTDRNATAVGVVMALQFGPQLLLLPLTGLAADRLDRRRILLVTQTLMGLLALGLGLLTLSGKVQLWHVNVFAFLLGCVAAFDGPARQTFVSEVVPREDLANAVALNSTSFNAARMVGPAVAGAVIAATSPAYAFLINAASYIAVVGALMGLRRSELQGRPIAAPKTGGLMEGFRYMWNRPDLRAAMIMLAIVSTFGLNFPIFISTMSTMAFHGGAGQYGVLSSSLAVGSVIGALLAARRTQPSLAVLIAASAVFGVGCVAGASMPSEWLFAAALIVCGLAAQTLTTSSNSLIQLSTEPALRGRVIAIMLAIVLGSTPLGAPIVGWVADTSGPRWALFVGGASGFIALLVGLRYLERHRGLRISFARGRPIWSIDEAQS